MSWKDVKPPCKGECGWEKYLGQIHAMWLDPDYEWAEDFLFEVEIWVIKHKHITERQKQAIHNIKSKPNDSNIYQGFNYDEFWKDN